MRKTLAATVAMLILSSCASGAKQTPAAVPDITIAPAQLQEPQSLPDLQGADDVALLRNHVAVARIAHVTGDQLRALVCGLMSQGGFTVNGAAPVAPTWCKANPIRADPPPSPSVDNLGPS